MHANTQTLSEANKAARRISVLLPLSLRRLFSGEKCPLHTNGGIQWRSWYPDIELLATAGVSLRSLCGSLWKATAVFTDKSFLWLKHLWSSRSASSCSASSRRCVCACMWTQLPSQELQAAANSEAKKMPSMTFFKTIWHVEFLGHLDYFRQAARRHFMVLLCIYLCLNSGLLSLQ